MAPLSVGLATGAGRGMGMACASRLKDSVDTLLLVDREERSLVEAADSLSRRHRGGAAGGTGAVVEALPLDVTDDEGLARLASRISELGTLRAVAHAAGISPTMADWRSILSVDLVGTAKLVDALRPLVTSGTAIVCFASMAPLLALNDADPAADAVVDDPTNGSFLERLHEVIGESIEDTGVAYSWAKRGVQRLVRREALRLGPLGARICSVSPGVIDTPQGRQEAQSHPFMKELVERTPIGRREGHPEEVAAVVAFLLSEEASFVTGIDVLVDGGVCAALQSPAPPA